ncbi:hypothetical protein [Faecalispora jeddahensis]|uniref:hypothetical protein n=1 Tax=Faecalispora jeddahensis TaxID=1414721 RepID=UPI00145A2E5F|nr:hypothetical protein [Faecalispora jeddahensis]
MNSFKGLSILDFDIFGGNSCGAEFGTLPQSEQAMDFLAFSDDMDKKYANCFCCC